MRNIGTDYVAYTTPVDEISWWTSSTTTREHITRRLTPHVPVLRQSYKGDIGIDARISNMTDDLFFAVPQLRDRPRGSSENSSCQPPGTDVSPPPMARAKITADLVERAISGETRAINQLIKALTPLFMYRIGRVLVRHGVRSRDTIEDVCQDSFVALLIDDGRLLRGWDPTRGRSFENYTGLMAKRLALQYVNQNRKQRFEIDDGDVHGYLDQATDSSRTPERLAMSNEMLHRIFARLKTELSPLGQQIFELLFVDGREVDEVCTTLNMQRGAVYVWRSRLGLRIEEVAATLEGEP